MRSRGRCERNSSVRLRLLEVPQQSHPLPSTAVPLLKREVVVSSSSSLIFLGAVVSSESSEQTADLSGRAGRLARSDRRRPPCGRRDPAARCWHRALGLSSDQSQGHESVRPANPPRPPSLDPQESHLDQSLNPIPSREPLPCPLQLSG